MPHSTPPIIALKAVFSVFIIQLPPSACKLDQGRNYQKQPVPNWNLRGNPAKTDFTAPESAK